MKAMKAWIKFSDVLKNNRALVLMEAWRECAGPAVSEHAKFMGVHNIHNRKTLLISVADPIWRQELFYQKEIILKRFIECLKKYRWPEKELPEICTIKYT
jgi:hypothetical protein